MMKVTATAILILLGLAKQHTPAPGPGRQAYCMCGSPDSFSLLDADHPGCISSTHAPRIRLRG